MEKRQHLWTRLDELLQALPRRNLLSILGDFNCSLPAVPRLVGMDAFVTPDGRQRGPMGKSNLVKTNHPGVKTHQPGVSLGGSGVSIGGGDGFLGHGIEWEGSNGIIKKTLKKKHHKNTYILAFFCNATFQGL